MKKLLTAIIKFYRKHISPRTTPKCKYYPTCSQYALDALERFGAKGIFLALWRITRCNMWSLGGIDYVPEKFCFYFLYSRRQNHKKRLSYNRSQKSESQMSEQSI
ncbi:MAG: membrane protein insertion efficiency factor YidD [Ruminococcus sp.]|nr:membrane protein insertion efficiency factor YidD [Ruminococcus sp.]